MNGWAPLTESEIREERFMMELAEFLEHIGEKHQCGLAFYIGEDGEVEIHAQAFEAN